MAKLNSQKFLKKYNLFDLELTCKILHVRLTCKIKIIAYNPVHKLFNDCLDLYDLVKWR